MSVATEQAMPTGMIDHLPPQSPEAEEAVLGSILMDPEAVGKIGSDLKPTDFYRERNGQIYGAGLALFQSGTRVDFLTVVDELKRRGIYDEVGSLPYLSQLLGAVPTAVHVEHYAAIVKRTAVKRRLISAAGKIAGLAYDDSLEVEDVMARAQKLLTAVATERGGNRLTSPAQMADVLLDMVFDIAERGQVGVPSGFYRLDEYTNGFRAGEMVTVLGDTTIGKSAWALSLARNVAASEKGGPVLYCSIEMSLQQMAARLAAGKLGINWKEFERQVARGENVERNTALVREAADWISKLPITWYYQPAMSVLDVRTKAMEMRALGPLSLVVVDYAQLLMSAGRAESRVTEMGEISRGLKRTAGELGVPLVALCQISREAVKGRDNKRPGLHDARESGSWEQDSDILLGVYRDDAYYDVGKKNDRGDIVEAGEASLLLLKNRTGERGYDIRMRWMAETAQYLNPATMEGRAI